ncbi:MAG TPA: hypothetical protein VGR45_06270, partial [Stellaceae bacterium]|nr:hypothetical protein [Stellaceae bacterium]
LRGALPRCGAAGGMHAGAGVLGRPRRDGATTWEAGNMAAALCGVQRQRQDGARAVAAQLRAGVRTMLGRVSQQLDLFTAVKNPSGDPVERFGRMDALCGMPLRNDYSGRLVVDEFGRYATAYRAAVMEVS